MDSRFKITKWMFSHHAKERCKERHISEEDIQILLNKPDQVIEQGPKLIFVKKFPQRKDNNLAAVVLEKQEGELWLVITVMVRFEVK